MQNINGDKNVQILGDGNIITVLKPFKIDRTSHAAEMAKSSSINVYRLFSGWVEFPMMLVFMVSMFAISYFGKSYFNYLFGLAAGLLVIWYFLPIKIGTLLGTVQWDRFDRGFENTIPFKDIHLMQMVGKNIHIITFDRKNYKVDFLNPKGTNDLFNAFSIYVKL